MNGSPLTIQDILDSLTVIEELAKEAEEKSVPRLVADQQTRMAGVRAKHLRNAAAILRGMSIKGP